jgi:hypothetical protein
MRKEKKKTEKQEFGILNSEFGKKKRRKKSRNAECRIEEHRAEDRGQGTEKQEFGMRKMEDRWNRRSKNCMAPDTIIYVSGRSHLTSDLCHLTSDLCSLTSDIRPLISGLCHLTS